MAIGPGAGAMAGNRRIIDAGRSWMGGFCIGSIVGGIGRSARPSR
jgi:hypothetical protein